MASLREEIEALDTAQVHAYGSDAYVDQLYIPRDEVLAIIDRHEKKSPRGSVVLTTFHKGEFLAAESIPIDVPKHTVRWPIATQEVEVQIRISGPEARDSGFPDHIDRDGRGWVGKERVSKSETCEERPARRHLFDADISGRAVHGEDADIRAKAIVEAIDALGKRLEK